MNSLDDVLHYSACNCAISRRCVAPKSGVLDRKVVVIQICRSAQGIEGMCYFLKIVGFPLKVGAWELHAHFDRSISAPAPFMLSLSLSLSLFPLTPPLLPVGAWCTIIYIGRVYPCVANVPAVRRLKHSFVFMSSVDVEARQSQVSLFIAIEMSAHSEVQARLGVSWHRASFRLWEKK